MEKLKLNETPVRTSRNFNINNIKLENISIPKKIEEFENVEIIKEQEDIKVNNQIKSIKLTYGLSDELTDLVNEMSNCKLNFEVNGKCKKFNKFICIKV